MTEMLLLCGALSTLLLVAGREIQRRIKRRYVYGRRDVLSMPAIWRRHFAVLGIDEARCAEEWLHLAQTFKVEPGQLRVTDRFDRELRNLDHLLDGWLLRTIATAQAENEHLKPSQIKTVRDFVLLATSIQSHSDIAHRA
jgi:hypothetical protein